MVWDRVAKIRQFDPPIFWIGVLSSVDKDIGCFYVGMDNTAGMQGLLNSAEFVIAGR